MDVEVEYLDHDLGCYIPVEIKDVVDEDVTVSVKESTDDTDTLVVKWEDLYTSTHHSSSDQSLTTDVYSDGDQVQVRSSAESYGHGWYDAVVSTVQDEGLYSVHYAGYEDSYDEIVVSKRIRSNKFLTQLDSSLIEKYEIPFSEHLLDACVARGAHASLASQCGALVVLVEVSRRVIVVVGAVGAIERASLLADLHLDKLESMKSFTEFKGSADYKIKEFENSCIMLLTISEKFMRYAIGKSGNNIKQAQAVAGIISVNVLDDTSHGHSCPEKGMGTIEIVGESEEALHKAKDLLSFCHLEYPVKRSLLTSILGPQGKNIQELIDKTKVTRLYVNHMKNSDKDPILSIIGRERDLEMARLVLDAKCDLILERQRMYEERQAILNSLRKFGIDTQMLANAPIKKSYRAFLQDQDDRREKPIRAPENYLDRIILGIPEPTNEHAQSM